MGQIKLIGLDYSRARDGWEMAQVEISPTLFTQVQLIELGARQANTEAIKNDL